MEIQTTTPRNLPKRKIWEIDTCFKCALIGTCLNRGELRKLGREKIYQTPPRLDDYQLHVHFIGISDRNDGSARVLDRYLEKKYRAEARKYRKTETEAEIMALWEQDLAEGRIDSAWWGVLTHPHASADIMGKCFGQLHMIGHDRTNSFHRDRQLIASLRAKSDMLEEIVGSERDHFRRERKQLLEENRMLNHKLAAMKHQLEEHRRRQGKMEQPGERIGNLETENRVPRDQQLIDDLRQDNNSLSGRLDELTGELEALREELAKASRQLLHLRQIREQMEQHELEQAGEIASLEAILFQRFAEEQDPCANCADRGTANCPALDLYGKTVLYVGGLHKMVPHYRQLVEQSGGRFIHHDGGKEASRNLLPKLLNTADAVLCPIDCVSHDACNCVKKMCKRYQKPFVLMRSSGLSSLARGLNEIVQ